MSGYHDSGCQSMARPKELLPSTPMECPMTKTWKDDRTHELRRLSYRKFYRIIFPPPILLVWFPPLAWNQEEGYGLRRDRVRQAELGVVYTDDERLVELQTPFNNHAHP